ncbi:MAG: hypothetical protein BMS9Abin05_0167 [Rhodothermia bacterium]|nr:MAG: hypothetical protein BMS9Abin05_0167 [Rhodothermia bacterium]
MNPFLNELLDDIEHLRTELHRLTSDLSDEEMQRPPAPKSWSILSCVAHITKTGNEYLPRLQKAANDSPTIDNSSLSYRPSWIGKIFLSNLSPSSRRRLSAPKKFKPVPTTDCSSTRNDFNSQLDELSDLIRRVDGRDFNLVRFSSPVSPLIRFSLADGLAIVVIHARRHMAQIAKIRKVILELGNEDRARVPS